MSDVSDDSYRQLNSIFCCVRSEIWSVARAYTTACTRDVLVTRAGRVTWLAATISAHEYFCACTV